MSETQPTQDQQPEEISGTLSDYDKAMLEERALRREINRLRRELTKVSNRRFQLSPRYGVLKGQSHRETGNAL